MKIKLNRRAFLAWTGGAVLVSQIPAVKVKSAVAPVDVFLPKTLMVALHTRYPISYDSFPINEASYYGYKRMPFVEHQPIDFPECFGRHEVITHFSLLLPDGHIWLSGLIAPELYVHTGITARLEGISIIEDVEELGCGSY